MTTAATMNRNSDVTAAAEARHGWVTDRWTDGRTSFDWGRNLVKLIPSSCDDEENATNPVIDDATSLTHSSWIVNRRRAATTMTPNNLPYTRAEPPLAHSAPHSPLANAPPHADWPTAGKVARICVGICRRRGRLALVDDVQMALNSQMMMSMHAVAISNTRGTVRGIWHLLPSSRTSSKDVIAS